MLKRITLLFFLLCLLKVAQAQQVIVKGNVIDEATHKGIPFATLSLEKK